MLEHHLRTKTTAATTTRTLAPQKLSPTPSQLPTLHSLTRTVPSKGQGPTTHPRTLSHYATALFVKEDADTCDYLPPDAENTASPCTRSKPAAVTRNCLTRVSRTSNQLSRRHQRQAPPLPIGSRPPANAATTDSNFPPLGPPAEINPNGLGRRGWHRPTVTCICSCRRLHSLLSDCCSPHSIRV